MKVLSAGLALGRHLALSLILIVGLAATPAFAEETKAPALWKVETEGSTTYFFGTFHILPPGIDWRTEEFDNALASADNLVVESNTQDQAAIMAIVQKHALNPEGVTLRSLLSDEEADKADKVLAGLGLSVDAMKAYRPWFAAMNASITAMVQAGFDPSSGVEPVLLAQASATQQPVSFLETPEQGILSLAGHSMEIEVKMFDAAMNDISTLQAKTGEMIEAWSTGDSEKLAHLMNDSMAEFPEVLDAVLYQRNANWMPGVEKIINTEGTHFVAVGAAHLAGENSVIELLREKGYNPVRQ